jgi:hypothetical protein
MKYLKNECGSSLILVVLSMFAIICFVGLVIDGGRVYMERSHLQKVANAAALSGAQELTKNETKVRKIVDEILEAHHELESLKKCDVIHEHKVIVHLKKELPLAFSSLFGFQTVPVFANASAKIKRIGKAVGAAPLGIDESVPLQFNTEYKLKVDQTEADNGFFGILALGGTGARTYEDNLRYGYQEEIKTGDIIETQTGNIAGKTRSGVQEKVDACYWTAGMDYERSCERIILVAVYKPYEYEGGQVKQVQVTGFAYFFITEPMGNNDTAITGMFIKMAGKGTIDDNAQDKGAYGIRLTE